jgi:DNA-binding XRE family transcriptional regulator
MTKYYAGIGSRETPKDICEIMTQLATKLANTGWVLRSGGAKGADQAFEKGVPKGFEKEIFYAKDATEKALILAEKYHPNWQVCSDYARKLHARNGMILLGEKLDSSVEFVICWTKDGKASGGSGQGIRIATNYEIPVFNLYNKEHLERINNFISTAS